MKKALIIIPAYNEEKNIEDVIKKIRQLSVNIVLDIVVVCDGPEDNTVKIVSSLNVPIIAHPINLGVGAAIQAGFKYANIKDFDMAVVVDGDGQHDPNEILKFIKAMEDSSIDVVIGSRFLSKDKVQTHWARKIGIKIFSVLVSLLGKCKITDVTSGFRAFNRRTIALLSKEMPADFPDADLILFLALSKYKIVEIPISSRERQHGESMYSLLTSIYYPFKLFVSILAVALRFFFEKEGVN
ncbi:hypothetical protein A2230_08135 [candidate division WOR-1 bacterium RIFOXYA2_FULL_36_21]|uniref:Glycosyltransferase 2-like domain-containing protein n=1 Tax=candidate division WOR-1 bacterium RIFOXYB2_FULL_36_35 TaxID=1802578 RepID=A0A1F4S846_UNCSA|nr:MAG: hypothetical protein A2230_08135 [candidate division WOR-1 bacterium RIFOXYA2_FULL_36_21]OGC14610.1 MAG: hypothetical protein A2282_04150 [candidate division WOR-1 bacterium RIFOXYA12_FULL_36_13]OGC16625.1 MAG: hypothetical protein A2290_03350 [candidate division WOR-1 bacterium RIFOXYB2_FULL_36_35]